jgi:hypothetical protein
MSLLFLTLLDLPKDQREKALHRVLPTLVPPQAQLAFAVITAEQDVKREAAVEQQLVTEAVHAAKFKKAEELTPFPTLNSAFQKLPASVQSDIFNSPSPSSHADREVALASNTEADATPAPRGRASSQPPVKTT